MRAGKESLAVLAALLLVQAAAAEPPNLAGRWTLIVDEATPAEGAAAPPIPATASSGWGRQITITLEEGRVSIERHQFSEHDLQPPMRYVYVLGGVESRNVVNMGRGPQEQVARAERRGEAVVITSRYGTGTPLAAEVRHVFSVDASGVLLVETTRSAAAATSTTETRYRRQAH